MAIYDHAGFVNGFNRVQTKQGGQGYIPDRLVVVIAQCKKPAYLPFYASRSSKIPSIRRRGSAAPHKS
jgi:hypothetical protein